MIKKMTAGTFGLTESVIKNDSSERLVLEAGEAIEFTDPETKYCKITFRGSGENAGGYININKYYPVLAGSTAVMELTTPVRLEVELVISAESTLKFDEIEIEELSQPYYLASECSGAKDVLVVVPNYPSFANLYLCAFAHSRNKEYQKKGIHIQVASILASNWYEMSYELEGIPVLQGNYGTLKQLLDSRQYHVIVTHFVDENLMSIYDGYVYPPDQLIFICHGAESIYRYVENLVRPYFTRPLIRTNSAEVFDRRDAFIKKYSQMDNAEWVFVSKWLKEFAEEQHRLKFKNSSVINNVINEQRFPYHAKNAEDRKKIIIIRKFDNCMVHSLDLSVRAILELSRKEFFKELSFEIYGDGDFYEVLTEPLRQFENVHFHRTFIPNDKLSEIYKEQGIALLPSRHDAHPVSMGECASSGLVVIGSRVTSNGYFMQEERFHTLADPEDPLELAQIIERLYYNPEEYLKISRELSEFTRENFCVEKTVEKEIELIRQRQILSRTPRESFPEKVERPPVLSVLVLNPAEHKKTKKCLLTLLNQKYNGKIEILLSDTGTELEAEEKDEFMRLGGEVLRFVHPAETDVGCMIKEGIRSAAGKYTALIHGNDWVDTEQFAELIERLQKEEADVVLCRGSYADYEKSLLEEIADYDMLMDGSQYWFEDLLYPGYGFKDSGPLLSTAVYRTEKLESVSKLCASGKESVDRQWQALSIREIDTIRYYDLNVYRYLKGERKKIQEEKLSLGHDIHCILRTIINDGYTAGKKEYVFRFLIAPLVYRQLNWYCDRQMRQEAWDFFESLSLYPEAYSYVMQYLRKKPDGKYVIPEKPVEENEGEAEQEIPVQEEKSKASARKRDGRKSENKNPENKNPEKKNTEKKKSTYYVKKGIKSVMPHGIVTLISSRRKEE